MHEFSRIRRYNSAMAERIRLVASHPRARDRSLTPEWIRKRLAPFLRADGWVRTIAIQVRKRVIRARAVICHRRAIQRYLGTHSPSKLHLGCGSHLLKDWLNTDLEPGVEVVCLDASKKLPIADRTFDYVFTEHMIEHLEFKTGKDLIQEIFRILKPGGKLRISTPDLQFLINLYGSEKTDLQTRYIQWAGETFLPGIDLPTDAFVINNFFRDWGHLFIYDFKTLSVLLLQFGFVDITRREVGQSDDVNLRNVECRGSMIGEEFNRLESLVVEATRSITGEGKPLG